MWTRRSKVLLDNFINGAVPVTRVRNVPSAKLVIKYLISVPVPINKQRARPTKVQLADIWFSLQCVSGGYGL